MDKRTIIGIVLIFVIMMLMPTYLKWIGGDQPVPAEQSRQQYTDSTTDMVDTVKQNVAAVPPDTVSQKDTTGQATSLISGISSAESEEILEVENEVVRVTWSTADGANPVKWELKKYDYYYGGNVQLIKDNGLEISFLNKNGKQVNLNN
ncbi:MAG: hypothetical protein WAN36_14005, partial [Calditrichia bacterium]